jgi:hypothetical protein
LAIEDFTLTTLDGSMSCIAIVLPTSAALAAADSIALKNVYQNLQFVLINLEYWSKCQKGEKERKGWITCILISFH